MHHLHKTKLSLHQVPNVILYKSHGNWKCIVVGQAMGDGKRFAHLKCLFMAWEASIFNAEILRLFVWHESAVPMQLNSTWGLWSMNYAFNNFILQLHFSFTFGFSGSSRSFESFSIRIVWTITCLIVWVINSWLVSFGCSWKITIISVLSATINSHLIDHFQEQRLANRRENSKCFNFVRMINERSGEKMDQLEVPTTALNFLSIDLGGRREVLFRNQQQFHSWNYFKRLSIASDPEGETIIHKNSLSGTIWAWSLSELHHVVLLRVWERRRSVAHLVEEEMLSEPFKISANVAKQWRWHVSVNKRLVETTKEEDENCLTDCTSSSL